MPTLFTRIIEGDLPGTFVWRDPHAVAFLSINPIRPGHTLVVPRVEVEHWIDLEPEARSHVFDVSHTIGRAIERAWDPPKVGLSLVGLEVPHVHVHLVPIWSAADLNFANAAVTVTREELDEAAGMIRAELEAMGSAGVSR